MFKKDIVFLIQGRHSELSYFDFLGHHESKVITLSWDAEVSNLSFSDHHYFLPESTWAEGRNLLLSKALEFYPNFEYVIFMDGDLRILEGEIQEFLDFLERYKPILGLPLSNQLKETSRFLSTSKVQTQVSFDQIMQAYSQKAIQDEICLPYVTELDHLSWWYSCEINQYLTVKYYEKQILQLNSFLIKNTHHTMEQTKEANSRYLGGITNTGIQECKKLIEKKFGKQGYLIGTLFQPSCLPNPVNVDAKLRSLLQCNEKWEVRNIARIVYYLQNIVYARVLKLFFRNRYPVQKPIFSEDFSC